MRWNRISNQNQNLSIEQFLAQKRNDLVIFQQKASEVSTKTFDELSAQIIQLAQMVQNKDSEIKNMQELCDKNKIDYTPKPPSPQTKPETMPPETKKK